jgi:hypothetical protein
MAPRLENQLAIMGDDFGFESVGNLTQAYATFYVVAGHLDGHFMWFEGVADQTQRAIDLAVAQRKIKRRFIGGSPRSTNLLLPEGISRISDFISSDNRTQVGIAAQKEDFFLVRFLSILRSRASP